MFHDFFYFGIRQQSHLTANYLLIIHHPSNDPSERQQGLSHMTKKHTLFFTTLILSLLLFSALNKPASPTALITQQITPGITIKHTPNNTANAFILTIDDLSLGSAAQIRLTGKIVEYIENKTIPTTFFAIPAYMQPYNFSRDIEIAQHGYDHINPKDHTFGEFINLTDKEIEDRLSRGKQALEKQGYTVYGHRAPGFSLKEKHIPLLKTLYLYDSSFHVPPNDRTDYIIPYIWHDLTGNICNITISNKTLADSKQHQLFTVIDNWTASEKPIVILSHFFDYEKILENNQSKECLNSFFDEINKRNYWKTTMKDYAIWKSGLNTINYTVNETQTELIITFNTCLSALTFETPSKKHIKTNCKIRMKHKNSQKTTFILK